METNNGSKALINALLSFASETTFMDLMKSVDPKTCVEDVFIIAAEVGNLQILEWLISEGNLNLDVCGPKAMEATLEPYMPRTPAVVTRLMEVINPRTCGEEVFIRAARVSNLQVMKWLIAEGNLNLEVCGHKAMKAALKSYMLVEVEFFLMEVIDPKTCGDDVLIKALEVRHLRIVKWLISALSVCSGKALIVAMNLDQAHVKELLIIVDPKTCDEEVFDLAVTMWRGDVLKWLYENYVEGVLGFDLKAHFLKVVKDSIVTKVPRYEMEMIWNLDLWANLNVAEKKSIIQVIKSPGINRKWLVEEIIKGRKSGVLL
jgi:hypothetical protein